MNFSFAPATREAAKARIALVGPSGCGKTKSALRIAAGLAAGGAIGLADTERRSALKYAPVPGRPDLGGHEFAHLPMDTHDPRQLIQVVAAAEAAGLAVLIVDSFSHFWNGRGGLLEIVERTGEKTHGGKFGAWRDANPIEQDMYDALLNFRGHLIVTMRARGDYVIEGKKVTKVGVKPVQREGAEYEFDVLMDMVEGTATVTKTRYEPLDGLTIHHPGEDVGETILDQLGQGVDPVAALVDAVMAEGLTYPAALELHARAKARRLLDAPITHPVTNVSATLGELIAERGTAVRPAPSEQPTPVPPPSVSAPAEVSPERAEMERMMDRVVSEVAEQPQTHAPAAEQQPAAQVGPPQMRAMHAMFNALSVTGRDDRLGVTSVIVGRDVPTANDLTAQEASDLLDMLSLYAKQGQTPDRDGFRKAIAKAREDAARTAPAAA
ncbi:AAA family ATPase [Streptomyces sp. URMC 129]|uniref:AAA family ATPase n=1 Tax=Streptomyces sp. URMC 129 TaxID=3423407 RepID=UPI003F1C058B